ncbi:NADPH:quinone oxidoreductase family protein [Paracoccus pantotrophus]|uniref:NADPH:quinone oxidoreductase family protein n=1 Tax=Paracoccus pantotrophus TaxID=82367 RepID=UPI00048E334E|nr:NADPH:quinone oxidoreductase family protein [Paracoccus pantotrophus]
MRALQVTRLSEDLGGVELRDIPRPAPGPGKVLIAVRAASVNYPDLLMARGEYQMKPDLPFTLGGDLAGEVVAVGEGVTRVAPGDLVTAIGIGAFCDCALMPEATVDPWPEQLAAPQAAAFGAAYLTAYVALVERGRMQPGDWVLVHGASGGMGLAAVDLAKALGARVIATSTSDEKLDEIRRLYAPDHVINIRSGFRDKVLEITGGKGADVIFDPVNGDVFDESVRCVAFDGRLLVVGFTGNRITSIKTNLTLIKAFSVVGVRAGEYFRRFPDRRPRATSALQELVRDGRICPHVCREFPIGDWKSAFGLVAGRQALGKVVLTL